MKSFKSLVTSKSFADLVYEEYAQKRVPIKNPDVYRTIVRTSQKKALLHNVQLSSALTFSSTLDCDNMMDTQSEILKAHQLPQKNDAVQQFKRHNQQLGILKKLPEFIARRLQDDTINYKH